MKQKQIADEEYKASTWKRQYNPIDGLIHTDDGKKYTLDGQIVDEEQLQTADMPLYPQYHDGDANVIEGFKAYDKWVDGLTYHKDGSVIDPATQERVMPPEWTKQ